MIEYCAESAPGSNNFGAEKNQQIGTIKAEVNTNVILQMCTQTYRMG